MAYLLTIMLALVAPTFATASEPVSYNDKLKEALPNFEIPATWQRSHPPFRIIGNVYGVGGFDLASYLITSPDGHMLINTGIEGSIEDISAHIDALGYDIADVKILLSMQSHCGHTADLARIAEETGAKMYATASDARVLEDGGFSDPHFGGLETFRPIKVDKIVSDGEVIELGEIKLTVHYHPGHTEGSSSYAMAVQENGKTYNVLIANMGTINAGKKLVVEPTYPGVAEDFAYTYRTQKAMPVDSWVAAHKSQYGFYYKYDRAKPYSPETFVDPEGFVDAVENLEAIYRVQRRQEAKEREAATGN